MLEHSEQLATPRVEKGRIAMEATMLSLARRRSRRPSPALALAPTLFFVALFRASSADASDPTPPSSMSREERCENGELAVCVKLGDEAWHPRRNLVLAAHYFTYACDRDHAPGCTRLADMMVRAEGMPYDDRRAVELYGRACLSGDQHACVGRGRMAIAGRGTPRNVRHATLLWAIGCDTFEDPESCGWLGWAYGRGLVGDSRDAGCPLMERACAAGSIGGCALLGHALLPGGACAADPLRAVTLLSGSCDAGDPVACTNLGWAYSSGVAGDLATAWALHARACEMGSMVGCVDLANLYAEGRGDLIPRDLERAQGLLARACRSEERRGCREHARVRAARAEEASRPVETGAPGR